MLETILAWPLTNLEVSCVFEIAVPECESYHLTVSSQEAVSALQVG